MIPTYKEGGVNRYWEFKNKIANITKKLSHEEDFTLSEDAIQNIISLNPNYYHTYYVLGLYYKSKKEFGMALKYLNEALQYQIPRKVDKDQIISVGYLRF